MVFHWSLSDKSPKDSSILADLNNPVVWMDSTRPIISKTSCAFSNPLATVPRVPITIGIAVTFILLSFFNPQARSSYISLFSLSFNFTLWSARITKSTIRQVLLLLVIFIRCGCLGEVKWSISMSKSERFRCVLFSRTNSGLPIQYLFELSNFNFLSISQWITLFLYSFCASLQHLLIKWLIVSSLSPHNLHPSFCSVISILTLILFIPLEFFTSALADGLSPEFDWQQISSSLQGSSQYSERSQ